jgi:hypothetical protein
MDALLDRVRAANPVAEAEFAGRANFEALPLAPPRRRRRLLALPALGAVLAALVLLPASAPQASEILRNAVNAVAVDDGGILYARSEVEGYGTREVWVLGDRAMRWRGADGAEEVFADGRGTTRRSADGRTTTDPGVSMVPGEVFRARGLRVSDDVSLVGEATVRGRPAYVLRWNEQSGPPHWPTIEMTLWVEKETYAPLRFTDHAWGKAADGKPFDTTYREEILEFKTLPDTPENRRLLELSTIRP